VAGYTTQLRGLNTAEGDFHAEVTTWNAQIRKHVAALESAHPDHRAVTQFAKAIQQDRELVWDTWKRALPVHLRPIVLSVKERHHGPGLSESGSTEYRSFLALVKAVCGRTRRRLDDLVAAIPGDAAAADCYAAMGRRVRALEDALARHQGTSPQ
jgi:hypothetical protein